MATEPFMGYLPEGAVVLTEESEKDELLSKDKGKSMKKIKKLKAKSVAIVNVAAGLDGCDDQLLPASFRALEAVLKFHPLMLGLITLTQTMCLSLFCPVWGYLSDKYSRKLMLTIGTIAWGTVTVCLGVVSEFWQVLVLRGLNGIALGSLGPISQSILADVSEKQTRGFSFGLVQLSSCIGRLIGGVVTTSIALLDAGAIKGWRLCFICVGGLSIMLGVVIALFLEEIPRKKRLIKKIIDDNSGGTGSIVNKKKCIEKNDDNWFVFSKKVLAKSLSIPSVVIVIFEGFFGTIPWSAFSFNTMFFQYCNMSDVQAAFITGALLVGAGIGGVVGGILGDYMYKWSRCHGRPAIGQLAMIGRVPLLILAYLIVPKSKEYFVIFLFLAFVVGLSCMAGVAVNRPILADVVRPDHRGTVFALTVTAEGTIAALFGAPLVGFLAEKSFGYVKTNKLISEMDTNLRLRNANALANSLALLTAIPWFISFLLYAGLHFTYGKDQESMRQLLRRDYHPDEDEIDTDDDDDDNHTEIENGITNVQSDWLRNRTNKENIANKEIERNMLSDLSSD